MSSASEENDEESNLSVEEDEVDASSDNNEERLSEEKLNGQLERIAANDPTLTRVAFNDMGIGDDGAGRLVQALQGNTVVTVLGLRGNRISEALVSALMRVLETSTALKVLDLSGNNIGDEGARAVAGLLHDNSSLTRLFLSNCGIGAVGARALAGALTRNSSLTYLDLDENIIGDEGASVLARTLPGNSTLIRLDLDGNGISDAGAREMVAALPNNSSLVEVNMVGNSISDVGARLLAKALLVNCSVTTVYLEENDISQDLEQLVDDLAEINADAPNRQEALGLKIEWLVNLDDAGAQLLGFDEGAAKEKAVSLALDNLDSFVEAEQRRNFLGRLLGSSQHGETVANCVDIATGRNLYLDAAQCSAAPGVLMNILRAHRSLCTCKDVQHGLYPFMLLATMPEAGVGDVMELLLMNPDLVKGDMNAPVEH